jgi:hypothetical protein
MRDLLWAGPGSINPFRIRPFITHGSLGMFLFKVKLVFDYGRYRTGTGTYVVYLFSVKKLLRC